jgi:hypothetical protein
MLEATHAKSRATDTDVDEVTAILDYFEYLCFEKLTILYLFIIGLVCWMPLW